MTATEVDALEDEGTEFGVINSLAEFCGALEGPLLPLGGQIEFAGIEVVFAGVLRRAALAGIAPGSGGFEGVGAICCEPQAGTVSNRLKSGRSLELA